MVDLPSGVLENYLALADDSCVAILPHALRIVAELRVADALAAGPLPIDHLASVVTADVDALYRLMRAVASVGLFAESPGRTFALTDSGARLRSDITAGSWASIVNLESQITWLHGTEAVRTGSSTFSATHGDHFFGHKNVDAYADRMFVRRMRERAARSYPRVAEVVDWTHTTTVMDIGGADGYLLSGLLARESHLKGILFDRPAVVEAQRNDDRMVQLSGRIRYVAGSFFDELPTGADAHLLCSVLHDWTDEQASEILRNSRQVLRPGGRLHIVEMLVPEDATGHPSKWSDIGMMVLTGGRERTRAEFEQLLASSGYVVDSVKGVPNSYFSVITALENDN